MAAVVPDDEDADTVASDTIQKVVREAFKVGSSKISLEEMVSAGDAAQHPA